MISLLSIVFEDAGSFSFRFPDTHKSNVLFIALLRFWVQVTWNYVESDNCDLQIQGEHKRNSFISSNYKIKTYWNIVCFLLGNYPASGFYIPTFRNTLSVQSS